MNTTESHAVQSSLQVLPAYEVPTWDYRKIYPYEDEVTQPQLVQPAVGLNT